MSIRPLSVTLASILEWKVQYSDVVRAVRWFLECILKFGLPLLEEIRESWSDPDKVGAMKILGVLENDT